MDKKVLAVLILCLLLVDVYAATKKTTKKKKSKKSKEKKADAEAPTFVSFASESDKLAEQRKAKAEAQEATKQGEKEQVAETKNVEIDTSEQPTPPPPPPPPPTTSPPAEKNETQAKVDDTPNNENKEQAATQQEKAKASDGATTTADGEESLVVTLTRANFDDIVLDKSKIVLVQFSAPWCKHCQDLEPTWRGVAKKLAKQRDDIIVATMDATQYTSTAQRFDAAKGYPNIRLFTKEDKTGDIEFVGHRSENSIMSFIRMEGPWSRTYDFVQHFTTYKWNTIVEDPDVSALAYFYVPWGLKRGDTDVLSALGETLAEPGKEVVVGLFDVSIPRHRPIADKFDVKKTPQLIFFSKDNKKGDLIYPLDKLGWSFPEILSWVEDGGKAPSEVDEDL
eukprot:TRINITY_DN69072_c0_g1_i1.p1 TRINITY_DN69072_c0_g1~~TRINITY_DN69072_c0_g1_i1.p1  ORF type:complete len:394 (+),score=64.40 TRINITY_DN69072_c0_g1_i1:23-1204(+)